MPSIRRNLTVCFTNRTLPKAKAKIVATKAISSNKHQPMPQTEWAACLVSLAQAPEKVVQLTNGLTDAELRSKDADGAFSVLEGVCHLRDIETDGYTERIYRILNEDRPLLPDINGSRLAIERDYNNQNLEASVQSFAHARGRNIETLQALNETQINREGTLEGVGTISLGELLRMMREHDEDHIRELRTIRARLDAERELNQ